MFFAITIHREIEPCGSPAGRDREDYLIAPEGGYWRAIGFIEHTHSINAIAHLSQAEEVGFALGRFHRLVHDLDSTRLHETLPGFHVTPRYLDRFSGVASMSETRSFLTGCDFDYLYDAIRRIPFELGVRFITDYLEGDKYFKVHEPEQNLLRALTQFKLTADIEQHERSIKELIRASIPRRRPSTMLG